MTVNREPMARITPFATDEEAKGEEQLHARGDPRGY